MGCPQWTSKSQHDFLLDMSVQYRSQRKPNTKKTDYSNFWPMLNAQWLTKWPPRTPTSEEIQSSGGDEALAQEKVVGPQLKVSRNVHTLPSFMLIITLSVLSIG